MSRSGRFWKSLPEFGGNSFIFVFLIATYHYVCAYIAYLYSVARPADALDYWFLTKNLNEYSWSDFLYPGTGLVLALNWPLVSVANLSLSVGFLIYSTIGLAGILAFYRMAVPFFSEKQRDRIILFLLVFLPSLHFWTSIIGKEPLCFLLTVLCFERILRKKFLQFFLFCVLLGLIRPHYAFIVLSAFVISLLFDRKIQLKLKLTALLLFALFSAVFYFFLGEIANLKPDPFTAVARIYKRHIEVFKQTDAYVPLDQYPLPYKIFTFYFRPFPFERFRWDYFAAGLENLLLLSLFLLGAFLFFRRKQWKFFDYFDRFTVVYFFIFAVVFVYAYANFGIIMRTKIMALPFIYLVLFRKR